MSDPRLAAIKWLDEKVRDAGWSDEAGTPTAIVLADLDAADRDAGIVRVDTRDEALVERLALVIINVRRASMSPTNQTIPEPLPISQARAILAALREAR